MAYQPGVSFTGGSAMGAGLASAGQSIGQGIGQAVQNRELRKRYGKILEGSGMDPDEIAGLSLGEMQGAVESAAMRLVQRKQEEQLRAAEMQNEAFARHMAEQEAARQGEQMLMGQLRQLRQGTGGGVLLPEVAERYRLALQDPAVAAAADTGVPLEAARRFFPSSQPMSPLDAARTRKTEAEAQRIERELAGSPGTFGTMEEAEAALGNRRGQAVQGNDGRWRIQFSTGPGADREHSVQQLLRLQREAEAGGDAEAAGVYQGMIEKALGKKEYSAQELLIMRAMGIDVNALTGASKSPGDKAKPPDLDPEEAKRTVLERLGF